MADALRPGSLAWYASQEGKRGQYAQPQSYSEFAGEQEPGYGENPYLRSMSLTPGPDAVVNGLQSLAGLVGAVNTAVNAPWYAKPLAVLPAGFGLIRGTQAWRNIQQGMGTHPTQDHQRHWERILAEAMGRLPPK